MFIKRCARVYKGKVYESFWLVESYRENNKIKCRYLLNITKLPPSCRENLAIILNPKNTSAYVVEDFENFYLSGFDYGQIVFFLYLFHKMGIIEILSKRLSKKAFSLIAAVLLNRILKPTSKMEAINWIKETVFPYFSSLRNKDYHANYVYEAMDEVYNNLDVIMEDFYKLCGGDSPVFLLYDITSVYFEGEKVKIAKRGYSRDRRKDRPQVLLGLVLNERGLPIHFEILEGNIKDESTVLSVIKKIKERFGIEKGIFVGDRGMTSVENITKITQEGLGYIMALRHEEAKDLLEKECIQLEIFDEQLPITIYTDDNKKYVLCGSKYRKEKEVKVLEVLLAKGRKALEEVKRMQEKGKIKRYDKVIRRAERKLTESGARRYFDFSYKDGIFKILEKKEEIERAKRLCGYYILETSEVAMKEEEVEERYKGLKQVERCFSLL